MTIICIDSTLLLKFFSLDGKSMQLLPLPVLCFFCCNERKYEEICVFLGTLLFSDSGEVKSHSKFGISNYENDIDTQWNIKYVSFLTADEPF